MPRFGVAPRGRGIENEGFVHLGKMAKMEKLSLRHCERFSPKSLDQLKGLKNLKALDLYYAFAYRDDTSGCLACIGAFSKSLAKVQDHGCPMEEIKGESRKGRSIR